MARFSVTIDTPQESEPATPLERLAERNRISTALAIISNAVGNLGRFSGSVGQDGNTAIAQAKFTYHVNGRQAAE